MAFSQIHKVEPSSPPKMLNIQVHIESIETIKPSIPTPDDRKSYKFCFMDQFMPPYYIPFIFFYHITDGHNKIPQLKESLSETLTKFYPLAGRIKDNTSIDCNDEGIPFVEAHADCCIADFLKDPDAKLLHNFVPCKMVPTEPFTNIPQVVIRVTVFTCGGLAIGVCFNHKILDAASIGCFLRIWKASISCCHGEAAQPEFEAASEVFPPREDILTPVADFMLAPTDNLCILKRFVFDATAIRILKEKARSETVPNPTRVEVVSAFMWKHTILKRYNLLHNHSFDDGKITYLTHAVNIRKHAFSSIPKSSVPIGCLNLSAKATLDLSDEKVQELNVIVSSIHEAITRVDAEYVRSFQGEDAIELLWKSLEILLYDRESILLCTSFCHVIDCYEFDLGWGKPTWVSLRSEPPLLADKNYLTLMDASDGEGTEAWFVVGEQEADRLENDDEFLAFATPVKGIVIQPS